MGLAPLVLHLLLAANPYLPRALKQIRALEEQAALKTLDQALRYEGSTETETATAHLYLGLVHATRAKEAEAIAAFKRALALDPELRLPDEMSPAVMGWWKRAGGKLDARQPALVPPPPVIIVQQPPPPAEPPPPPWKRYLGVGISGGAVISLGSGLLVGQRAVALKRLADGAVDIGIGQSYQRGAESWATSANALFVVAGVLAVVGVLLIVFGG